MTKSQDIAGSLYSSQESKIPCYPGPFFQFMV